MWWYIYHTTWPVSATTTEETALQLPHVLVVQHVSPTTVPSSYRCTGILYEIRWDRPAFPTAAELAELRTHFWSCIVQTPFKHSAIAVTAPDKVEWLALLPRILDINHLTDLDQFTISNSRQEALQWLHQFHTHRPPDTLPPVTFSNMQ